MFKSLADAKWGVGNGGIYLIKDWILQRDGINKGLKIAWGGFVTSGLPIYYLAGSNKNFVTWEDQVGTVLPQVS